MDNFPPDWKAAKRPGEDDVAGQTAFDLAWQRKMFDGGWAGVSWPK